MKTPKVIVPTEEYEQVLLVQWLEEHNYKFTSIPNAIPSQALRLKHARSGLRPGLPDLLIVLKCSKLLWIELKRCKPATSKVSAQQKIWQQALNTCGTQCIVCYGAEAAKAAVLQAESTSP